jgi:CDP-diacylglycerol--glycerol-3-phosphate 3-phosphatidyltransferase
VSWFLVHLASDEMLFGFTKPLFAVTPAALPAAIIYFTTLLTVVSGFSYFWKNRTLFNDA